MIRTPIAVTGSTGVLGGLVAKELADRDLPQRLLVRTPDEAPDLPNSEVRQFSYGDRAASTDALEGIEVVFMVSASEAEERLDEHRAFIDAAAAAGVRHLVYTSFFAAAPDATFHFARDHFVTEEYIKASGMDWTFLRDNFYLDMMENLVGYDGVIRAPAGDGRVSMIARADIARVAAVVLADPAAHVGRTYDLTGPEALTFAEVAAAISDVRGRDVTFQDESIDEAYESRATYGAPDWQVDAWVSTYTAVKSGEQAPVTDDVATLTGTAPMSLREYLRTS